MPAHGRDITDLTVDGFDHSIAYRWGSIVFRGRYRFPLYELGQALGLGKKATILSAERLAANLSSRQQRADFYWLVRHGLVSLDKWRLDISENTTSFLRSQNLTRLADALTNAVKEVEFGLGTSSLPAPARQSYLNRYGLCAMPNLSLLNSALAESDDENPFSRLKQPTHRTGQPAADDKCMQLIRSVLRKQERPLSFDGYPLYRRVMPSAGSLCCVEAVLLSRHSCCLYDSLHDNFLPLDLAVNDIAFIHSDLWLNAGSEKHDASSTVILFATQVPFSIKYGDLTAFLQAIDTGIILADLWHMMPSQRLRGCILGNPMAGPLLSPIASICGDALPISALMLFEEDATAMNED